MSFSCDFLCCRDNFLLVNKGSLQIDFVAFGLCLILTILLMWGMKETKTANNSEPPTNQSILMLRPLMQKEII